MKNVAATRGHSVSLAMPFLGLGRAWALRSAGSDNVLNFSLSPSSATSPLKSDTAWPAFRRIHFSLRHAREKASSDEFFLLWKVHLDRASVRARHRPKNCALAYNRAGEDGPAV